MSTTLAKQLALRLKAQNLTPAALEKEAGLTPHAALNIVRGKSKRPSAQNLQAIANVLGCTIPDLLENHDMFQEDEEAIPTDELLTMTYKKPELFQEVLTAVNNKITHDKLSFTTQQVFNCVQEVYLHALQKKLDAADTVFLDWFLKAMNK
jgi:transcriptional regulator with XRE-family HTH domain